MSIADYRNELAEAYIQAIEENFIFSDGTTDSSTRRKTSYKIKKFEQPYRQVDDLDFTENKGST